MKYALALVSLMGLSTPSAPLLAQSLTGTRAVDSAHIPHPLEVREFIPPPKVVPKQVPPMRVDSAITLPMESGRTLTVLRGEASTLPDLPKPPPPQTFVPQVLTAEDLEREAYQRQHTLQIGAAIFNHRVSVAHWRHPDTGEAYEAVCGFDLGLLEGTGHFVKNGDDYLLMLMLSYDDTDHSSDFAARMFPNLPEVPAGAIIILKGNPHDPVGTAPITLLEELIANEKDRLKVYQVERLRHQQDREAWHKANPKQPRDETIWLKPHRGSRYLVNPKPEINR